jgi:arylsulfatase
MATKQPNILIISTDQQSVDCLGCAGHPVLKTPSMDRLASEGMRFPQAVTVSPICAPARTSFLTGLYPHNHGMWWNSGACPPECGTFFHHLQKAGYLTAHIGKAHYYHWDVAPSGPSGEPDIRKCEPYMHALGMEYVHETPGQRGLVNTWSCQAEDLAAKGLLKTYRDDFADRNIWKGPGYDGSLTVRPCPLPLEEYPDSYVGRKTCEFVTQYGDERPMCLFVGFPGPHEPWNAPEPYASMYRPEDAPPPIPRSEQFETLSSDIQARFNLEPGPELTPDAVRRIRANYYGKVSLVDDWVGRILDAFKARGWLDDLMVVLWSDHGEGCGDHGRLYKYTFYEYSVRVPLIVRWPGHVQAGTTSDALAEIVDVFPTLLEAAGAPPSDRCQGRSLAPVLRDPHVAHRDSQLSEIKYGGHPRNLMLRTRRWKYACDEGGLGFMLHDLVDDPMEQHNLAGQPAYASIERELRDQLFQRLMRDQPVLRS